MSDNRTKDPVFCDERLLLEQTEFRFWRDGDLEVDHGTYRDSNGVWAGFFLSHDAARVTVSEDVQ